MPTKPREQTSPHDESARTRSPGRRSKHRAPTPQRQGDRASGDDGDAPSRRFLTGPQVQHRYGVTDVSLWRWLRDPKVKFPPPTMTIHHRRFWDEAELIAWEKSRTKAAVA